MKQLVTLLVVAALGFFGFKKVSDWLNRGQAVALSNIIEPFYNDLFRPLNVVHPVDLVPPLETIKKRVIEKQAHAEPEKRVVYEKAIILLNGMAPLAQERTKTLESVLKGIKTKATLDGPNSSRTTTGFFARLTAKRWDEVKMRQKPLLDQMFVELRTAEFVWNQKAGRLAQVEDYELPEYVPAWITVSQPASPADPVLREPFYQQPAASAPPGWSNRSSKTIPGAAR